MNFDELRKQWNDQSSDDLKINIDLNKVSSVGNILQELKRSIKKEFKLILLSIIFLIVVPYLPLYKIQGVATFFYYFFMFSLLLTSIVNFVRFKHFMRVADDFEVNSSKESLLKIYYELKYALDTYLVNTIAGTPAGLGLAFIIFSRGKSEIYFDKLIHAQSTYQTDPMFFFWIILITIFMVIWISYLVYYFYIKCYGKRLKQIKDILDELEY